MALATGARLGPYEVVAPLGAGGMGEVYRARDARLGRDVAIKVLPAGLTQDADRLKRFEQEARAAGQLNHPNVLAVHDVGSHEGAPYVVSELLEGETLRERLGGAGLPVRKTIEVAVQVARGLAAAHEKGIVHRDLKPENVFVAKDGQIKILDFGLAKLTHGEASPGGDSALATATRGTDPGTVLGTVGYMSPEQVRGRALDHRSDIFSFGAILYEMLSGRRAFKGDTAVETLNAILKDDPPELAETGKALPPALERIVRHCLEKNPEERFASARDLAFDLQALSDVSSATPALAGQRGKRRRLTTAAFGLTALVAAGLIGFLLGTRAERPAPIYRQLTFRRGQIGAGLFAPDGHTIVYSAAWDGKPNEVFATQPDAPESRPLGVTGFVVGVAQGEAAVAQPGGSVVKVPVAGGPPRAILENVLQAFQAPDGSGFAVVREVGGQQRLEFPVGTVLYKTPGEISLPRVARQGGFVAFIDRPMAGYTRGSIAVVDASKRKRTLTPEWAEAFGLAWSADGSEVWFTAAPLDSASSRELHAVSLSGRERLVARMPGSLVLLDIAPDGRVLLSHERPRYETRGRAPGEELERDLSWLDRTFVEDLSPDGRTLIFHEAGSGGGPRTSAFLRKMDGSPAVRLGEGMALALSPDARWVVASLDSVPGALNKSVSLLPTGAGEARKLPAGTIASYWDVWWLRDGKRLLIAASEAGRAQRLFLQDVPDGQPRPVTPVGVTTWSNTISPDDQWIAARPGEPGARFALYPVGGGDPRPIKGLEAQDVPLGWSADGRFLFISDFFALPAKVVRLEIETGRREPWLTLMPPDPAGVQSINYICLSADGRGYAYTYPRRLADLYLVEGLR